MQELLTPSRNGCVSRWRARLPRDSILLHSFFRSGLSCERTAKRTKQAYLWMCMYVQAGAAWTYPSALLPRMMLGSMHGDLIEWAWRLIGVLGHGCCFIFFGRELIWNGGDGPMHEYGRCVVTTACACACAYACLCVCASYNVSIDNARFEALLCHVGVGVVWKGH